MAILKDFKRCNLIGYATCYSIYIFCDKQNKTQTWALVSILIDQEISLNDKIIRSPLYGKIEIPLYLIFNW